MTILRMLIGYALQNRTVVLVLQMLGGGIAAAVAMVLFIFIVITALSSLLPQVQQSSEETLIKVCFEGTRILRMPDGTMWARPSNSFVRYRVENAETVCQ